MSRLPSLSDGLMKVAWRTSSNSRSVLLYGVQQTPQWLAPERTTFGSIPRKLAVNSNGQILHTRDGGDSWVVQLQGPSPTYFRCISFANENRGWCGTLTAARRMFHSLDGGANWIEVTNLPPLAPSAICGMSVVNDQVVFTSGTNYPNRPARMMKTLDGGESWSAWEMQQWADLLVDCYFTSPTTGWVVGGKSPVGSPTRANAVRH